MAQFRIVVKYLIIKDVIDHPSISVITLSSRIIKFSPK